eukprot:863000-Prorocentrum_minimum.AAC.1
MTDQAVKVAPIFDNLAETVAAPIKSTPHVQAVARLISDLICRPKLLRIFTGKLVGSCEEKDKVAPVRVFPRSYPVNVRRNNTQQYQTLVKAIYRITRWLYTHTRRGVPQRASVQ